MIKVTSTQSEKIGYRSYDSIVDIKGHNDEILMELKSLFESLIKSNDPELIHAVISHFLPKITDQLAKGTISEHKLSRYMDILENCKGGEY